MSAASSRNAGLTLTSRGLGYPTNTSRGALSPNGRARQNGHLGPGAPAQSAASGVGGRNLRLTAPSVNRKGILHHMTTRIRTWILLAGLTALFVGLGGLVGGASGLAVLALKSCPQRFGQLCRPAQDMLVCVASHDRPIVVVERPFLSLRVRAPYCGDVGPFALTVAH